MWVCHFITQTKESDAYCGWPKRFLGARQIRNKGVVQTAICEWLSMQDSDLYGEETVSLVPRLDKCIGVLGVYVENYGNSAE